jgi:putative pyruvate formate lyase activating enzyme
VEKAVINARKDGFSLPVVYNTSGFERIEVLNQFQGLVDIYLTDLRYAREESAKAGSGAGEYVAVSRAALKEMWRLAGPLKMDDSGVGLSGVICRLLILPGLADEVVENLEWMAANVGNEIAVSVMSQYLPAYKVVSMPVWNRKITKEEYDKVCEAMDRLGFNAGWVQDFEEPTPAGLVGYEMKEGSGLDPS